MGQNYHPDFDKVLKGEKIETSEAEILAAVRKILTAEEELDHQELAAQNSASGMTPAAHVIKRSLGALLPTRFRGRHSA